MLFVPCHADLLFLFLGIYHFARFIISILTFPYFSNYNFTLLEQRKTEFFSYPLIYIMSHLRQHYHKIHVENNFRLCDVSSSESLSISISYQEGKLWVIKCGQTLLLTRFSGIHNREFHNFETFSRILSY